MADKRRGKPQIYSNEVVIHTMEIFRNRVDMVAKNLDMGDQSIYNRCHALNLQTAGYTPLRKFTDVEFMQEFNRLHGHINGLALHFNCSRSCIKKHLKRLNITTHRQESIIKWSKVGRWVGKGK